MESSGANSNRIILGVLGAVGVVFCSYLLYKNFGSRPRDSTRSSQRTRKLSNKGVKKDSFPEDKSQQALNDNDESSSKPKKVNEQGMSKKLDIEEDLNQTSFVILSGNGENLPASSRKSDRSSDESSYDVVEAEEVDERMGKTTRERELDESMLDEMNASGIEASSSSFYHSAEETMNKDAKDRLEDNSADSTAMDEFHSQSFSQSHKADGTPQISHKESKAHNTKADSHASTISEMTSKVHSKSLDAKTASGDEESSASNYKSTASIHFSKDSQAPPADTKPKLATISAGTSAARSGDSEPKEDVSAVPDRELDAEEVSSALTACQNSPMAVTKEQIDVLVLLLKKENPKLQPTVLDSLVRVSAFTQNNVHLRNASCDSIVCSQVREKCQAILKHGLEDDTLLVAQTKVLTNLTMDPKVIPNLEACVSPLIDILIQPSAPESLQLSILRPLINLCSQNNFHSYYTPAIQRLYALLDTGSYNVQLQSIKVLVNLSLNEAMVPPMLSAKAPDSLLDLLDKPTHADVILRMLTMVGNLRATIAALSIDQSSLPPAHKAESPKTMYTAICGVVKAPLLRNKVYRLTRHSEEDIRLQASKLYTLITVVKK